MTPASVEQASRAFLHAADRLPTLWNLAAEWDTLLDLLEDPEADQEAVDQEMQRMVGAIKEKAHGVAVVLQGLERLADFQKAEADRLRAKAKANQGHADRLREYVKACMQNMGLDRLETGPFLLSVRTNPPHVEILDPAAIPSEYQRTKVIVEVDKTAILAAFKKDGAIVPGTAVERSSSLRVS